MATPTYKLGARAGTPYPTHISNEVRCQAIRRYGPGRTRCWRRYRTALPTGELVCVQCADAIRQGDTDISTQRDDTTTVTFAAFLDERLQYTGDDEDFLTVADCVREAGVEISAQRAGRMLSEFVRRDTHFPEPHSFRRGWKGYAGWRIVSSPTPPT